MYPATRSLPPGSSFLRQYRLISQRSLHAPLRSSATSCPAAKLVQYRLQLPAAIAAWFVTFVGVAAVADAAGSSEILTYIRGDYYLSYS